MLDRASSGANRRRSRKVGQGLSGRGLEHLEGRRLPNGSLASLPPVSALQYQGYQVVLDGSASNAASQTFTVTSSNPDIGATVAQGQFLTMNVSHASSGAGDPAFSGTIVLQLFNDLTPNTATLIEGFVNTGYYNGKYIFKVANQFPDTNGYLLQGGSPVNHISSQTSGLAGTPFPNEIVQQLGFTNPGQLAMANAGTADSNDTQFLLTSSDPAFLDDTLTIFGQVVSGLNVVNEMTQVALSGDPGTGSQTYPTSPIVVSSETLSNTNPNGVVHIDTTHARVGEDLDHHGDRNRPGDGYQPGPVLPGHGRRATR